MDVPFLKLDTIEMKPATPDVASAEMPSLKNETDDTFNKLVAEMINGQMKAAGLDKKEEDDKAKPKQDSTSDKTSLDDKGESATTPGQNPDSDLTTMVAQLNMADAFAQQQPLPASKADEEAKLEEMDMDATTNVITKTTQKTGLSAEMKNMQAKMAMNNDMKKVSATTTFDSSMLEEDVSDLKDLPQYKPENTNLDLAKLTQPVAHTPEQIQAVQQTVANLPQMPDMKPELRNKLVEGINSKNPVSATLPAAAKPVMMDENKALNAFNQLGGLINSHTQNLKEVESRGGDFKSTLDAVQGGDNQLEVELIPRTVLPSAEALGHESYNAKIKIYPPELGHVTAELRFDKGEAQLHIMTENRQVKEIVESNISQLKDKFQSADINLTSVNVQVSHQGARDSQQQQQQQQANQGMRQAGQSDDVSGSVVSDVSTTREKRNLDALVDTYV